MNLIYKYILIIFFAVSLKNSMACRLPYPDGVRSDISKSNAVGVIIEKKYPYFFVKNSQKNRIYKINAKGVVIYTAFGGDFKFHEVNDGVTVKVWYVNCANSKYPNAAYIEIYSNNPEDLPSLEFYNK